MIKSTNGRNKINVVQDNVNQSQGQYVIWTRKPRTTWLKRHGLWSDTNMVSKLAMSGSQTWLHMVRLNFSYIQECSHFNPNFHSIQCPSSIDQLLCNRSDLAKPCHALDTGSAPACFLLGPLAASPWQHENIQYKFPSSCPAPRLNLVSCHFTAMAISIILLWRSAHHNLFLWQAGWSTSCLVKTCKDNWDSDVM